MSKTITIHKSILLIVLSVFTVSGFFLLFLLYYQNLKEKQKVDGRYDIKNIVQACPNKEPWNKIFLQNFLQLTAENKINLFTFPLKEAEKKLSSFPVFKKVKLDRIFPDTLCIDYEMRNPLAFIENYQNCAIDEAAVIFPIRPFFSPKKLPEILLPKNEKLSWGKKIDEKKFLLIKEIMSLFEKAKFFILKIDLSQVSNDIAYGKGKIMISLQNQSLQTHSLQLDPDNFRKQIENYKQLDSYLQKNKVKSKNFTIDLRLSSMAFIRAE